MGGVNRALHGAHLDKTDPWTAAHPTKMVGVMAHLDPKLGLLDVPHLVHNLHNDHGEATVLSIRTPAAAVHLLHVVTQAS